MCVEAQRRRQHLFVVRCFKNHYSNKAIKLSKYNVHVSIFKDLGRRNWFLINKNANFMKLLGPYIHVM